VQVYTATLRVLLPSNPSPEGIDEQRMENRRLLMSILFLKPFAIVLASQAAKW
jgi:hypothetical protein